MSFFGNLASVGMSWLFWGGFLLFVFLMVFGSLWVRKRRKFTFPTAVLYDLGEGKIGLETTKSGWFKTNKILFKLIDRSGERRLEVKDGRVVQQGSTEDFHELNHKRGLIVRAKSDDPKILLPIKRITIKNKELLEQIAPSDFRDASEKIMREAERETSKDWEKLATFIVLGLLIIGLMICVIMVIQFANNRMDKANEIYDKAIEFKAQAQQTVNVKPSTTAP